MLVLKSFIRKFLSKKIIFFNFFFFIFFIKMISKLSQNSLLTNALNREFHKSGQVQFMPNPDLTQKLRMDKNVTRNQPERLVGSTNSGLIRCQLIPVDFRFFHRDRDLAKSIKIQPNSARFGPRFCQIMTRSQIPFDQGHKVLK